jgi:preprotein translocase YajC subunit
MSSYLNHVSFTVHGLVLAAAKVTTTTKASTTKSNPLLSYGILIFFGLAIYLLVLRPRQRTRQRQMQKKGANIGDEVMLASGIIGRVTSLEGDRATVEIAPEIEIEVVSRSIAQVLVPAVADEWDGDATVSEDPGAHHDGHDQYDDDDHDDDDDYDDAGQDDEADDAEADDAEADDAEDHDASHADQPDLGAGQLSDSSHPTSTTEQGQTP